ncbi:MAG: hypothetical protein MK102_15240 [Fuerstiella sp.]|nr:hypothetical protein [Fuerstiella sp.]
MQIIFHCPRCEANSDCRPHPDDAPVECSRCDWCRDAGSGDFDRINPAIVTRCRVCGCDDLWRQKDFPPVLGWLIVATGILLSSFAWAWHYPEWAIGTLMLFALADMILYIFMRDMLVCYRCRARHRKTVMHDDYQVFSHELSERYIQMKKRQDEESALR